MDRRRRRIVRLGAVGLALCAASIAVVTLSETATAAEIIALPPTGTVTVSGHGNGHGHGMSQYGAQGAALGGLSSSQILSFYYPGTTLTALSASAVRVQLSSAGTATTVASATGLTVTGVTGALPTTGISRYRLVSSGSGLALQKLSGSAWTTVKTGLPARADFATTGNVVRVYLTDGTSADYRGTVGAVRNGTGQITVNRLALDSYTQGVVPRESPSYWAAAALQAQAVAARSYGRNAAESHASSAYDICDTGSCQVYGGLARYSATGARLYGEEASTNSAVSSTSNHVLQYGGKTIFAQFSASDGGWTADGGYPYLVAEADPHDDVASGDPYLNWTRSVSVSSIASYYGLRQVTQIQITARDGHGQWGGRVLSGIVVGTDSAGHAQQVSTTGFGLQAALGAPTNWFDVQSSASAVAPGGSAVATTSSSVAFFYRTSTGNLAERTYQSPGGWGAAVDVGAPAGGLSGVLDGDPDAASWGAGHLDLAVRDAAGHLAIRTYGPDVGWLSWRTYPQVLGSSPSAVSAGVGSLDIFYLSSGYRIFGMRWTQGAGWTSAGPLPGVTNAASGPDSMAVASTGRTTVVYIGRDKRLWMLTRSGAGAWSTPTVVGGPLPSPPSGRDPSVGDTGSGAPGVFYTAANGTIYHASLNNATTNSWSSWYAVPGSFPAVSAPDVDNIGTHVDVIANRNGDIATTAWTQGSGWRPWSSLSCGC